MSGWYNNINPLIVNCLLQFILAQLNLFHLQQQCKRTLFTLSTTEGKLIAHFLLQTCTKNVHFIVCILHYSMVFDNVVLLRIIHCLNIHIHLINWVIKYYTNDSYTLLFAALIFEERISTVHHFHLW